MITDCLCWTGSTQMDTQQQPSVQRELKTWKVQPWVLCFFVFFLVELKYSYSVLQSCSGWLDTHFPRIPRSILRVLNILYEFKAAACERHFLSGVLRLNPISLGERALRVTGTLIWMHACTVYMTLCWIRWLSRMGFISPTKNRPVLSVL